mgnify:CR=1 FL=1
MDFAYKNYDSIKYATLGTAFYDFVPGEQLLAAQKTKEAIMPNWLNLGNYSTSGTSSTSGTGGTTIIAAGNYTWIG